MFDIGLDRFEEAGEDGDWDGDVAGGDEDGDNFCEKLQPGRVDGVAEAERLEHAPEAMIEVIAKHDHGDDIEEGDGPKLEAGDDVVVDVVFVEGAARMNSSKREVQEMEDDESQDDGPAPIHGPGSVGGMEIGFLDVVYGAGVALQAPELKRRPDVEADSNQEG